ncbi:hypothetical protein VNO78_16375 [Psophocarpus tetragonolobus]|uniref:NAC domain-containing protein n=1 Tax=Psophocarpus tetragonolobus TaxID=3891 RepID=A0AAN9XKF8_PSOTE
MESSTWLCFEEKGFRVVWGVRVSQGLNLLFFGLLGLMVVNDGFRKSWLIDIGGFAKKVKRTTISSADQIKVSSDWPGFPLGVKFDPSDLELVEHLAAKHGIGKWKHTAIHVLGKIGVMSISFTEQSMHMLLVNESVERFIIMYNIENKSKGSETNPSNPPYEGKSVGCDDNVDETVLLSDAQDTKIIPGESHVPQSDIKDQGNTGNTAWLAEENAEYNGLDNILLDDIFHPLDAASIRHEA